MVMCNNDLKMLPKTSFKGFFYRIVKFLSVKHNEWTLSFLSHHSILSRYKIRDIKRHATEKTRL